MERAISSAGWLAAGLLHIFQFATQASAMTAPFRAVTFAGTDGTASPSVYTPPDRARWQSAPLPRLQIRLHARCDAVRIWLPDSYPMMFTKMPGTWRDAEWGQSTSQIAG